MWGSEVLKAIGNQKKAVEMAQKATINKGLMILGLEKYIHYWQNRMLKCKEFATSLSTYVDY